ncbi:hypothetical protein HZ326_8186 [Fusarium oxysporum f. sp. albedinis]|nr:hypothetical protein HZ326_8186 [Fusarium oxysporum f. sp. albedinis]
MLDLRRVAKPAVDGLPQVLVQMFQRKLGRLRHIRSVDFTTYRRVILGAARALPIGAAETLSCWLLAYRKAAIVPCVEGRYSNLSSAGKAKYRWTL